PQAFIGAFGFVVVGEEGNDYGKADHEVGEDLVFLLEEGHGAFGDGAVNVADFFRQVLVEAKVERDRADLLHIVKRRPETKEGQQYDQYRRTCHAVYSPKKLLLYVY